MHKGFIQGAVILLALAVMLGAFGAHGLRPLLNEQQLVTYETAVRYQFYHAFALLLTGILFKDFDRTYLRWAGRLFLIGILIFSGSLYILTLLNLNHEEGFRWIGAITPLGGILFVGGWLLLVPAVRKNYSSNL